MNADRRIIVLIVEDDPDVRQSLTDILDLNGFLVSVATNGRDALAAARREPPDLILSDIAMPDMDGYDLVAAIRQHPPCCEIPFIFVTGRASRVDLRQGMHLGADDYITKPFSVRDVVEAVNARIRRQGPSRERVARLLAERKIVADAPWNHELMTPLCGILAGLELLETSPAPIAPAELKKLIAIIRAGAERQHALSRKLVTYYELERLKAESPRRPEFTSDVGTSLAARVEQIAATHGRADDLVVRFARGSVPVRAAHLIAAVAELVDNAFRFSQRGQLVTVSGFHDEQRYRIEVVDQGLGMTGEQRARVEAFRQFERDRREQQGLGLGLAIARSVVELAEGVFTLGPTAGGKGLKATLTLPGVASSRKTESR